MKNKRKLELAQTTAMSAIPPKMFATDETERVPVAVYTVSTKQQMHMSKVLSGVVAGTPASSCSETACSSSSDSQNTGKQSMALFSGAAI